MVFFTCNHCGDSVKKPAVEKHYNTKCRNPVFVSCMDCLKDFRENYVEHTRCISEAEKYSGKDYVPKESKNNGLKKQESWLEIVRSILTTKDFEVSSTLRGIFQKLQNCENVPRKKAKFLNFVSNSMHIKKDEAEAVWNVLEKALEKFKAAREADVKNPTKTDEDAIEKPENTVKEEIQENHQQAEESGQDDIKSKKKKNKKKRVSESGDQSADGLVDNSPKGTENGTAENQETEDKIDDDSKEKTKKNKKKRAQESNEASASPEQLTDEPTKKKRKKDKKSANGNGTEEEKAVEITLTTDVNMENKEQLPKESKKSKKESKGCENGEMESPAVAEEVEKSIPKQPLKTKNEIAEDQEEGATKEKKESEDVAVKNRNKFKVSQFNWTDVIFSILSKHNDEIGLEKLKTKVMKKYKAAHQLDTIPWKLEKTFNKKLRKSGLKLENDIVKINVK